MKARDPMVRRPGVLVIPVVIGSLAVTLFVLAITFYYLLDELTQALTVVIWAAALAGVGLAVTSLVFGGFILWEWAQQAGERTQQTKEQTKQARLATKEYEVRVLKESKLVTVAGAGDQVYLTDLLRNLTNALHLQAGPVNGEYIEPSALEIEQWRINQLAHATGRPAALPQPGEPAQLAAPERQALPEVVNLREYVFQASLSAIFLGVGRLPSETNPRPIVAALEKLVHIATAGSSGFGKSTFMQALAYQVLNAPGSRPILMDTQGVTFSAFEGHPALLARIASDERDILHLLDLLLDEMERRKGLFTQYPGVAKLSEYNARVHEPLPAIPTFFDEFGLLADNKAIAGKVRYIAQGGRKFGVYLVAGAQTWLACDISSALRANLSTSVQFAARDKAQSRVLIGSPEAANITQPGRALAVMPGLAGLIELQAPMIDEAELRPTAAAVIALPDPATARARAMYEAGMTPTAIAKEIIHGGQKEASGRDVRRINAMLGLPEKSGESTA